MKSNRSLETTGASPPSKLLPPLRILVVDDEPLIRRLCAQLLVHSGYEVDTAVNGADAWNVLQDCGYDLLITDNEMPQVSGIELLKILHGARLTLPVIMVSGTLPWQELARHPWLHLDAIISKPFDITEFTDTVEKVLLETHSAESFRDCAVRGHGVLLRAEKDAVRTNRSQIHPFRHILVVDDDPDARRLHMDLLNRSGYQAEGATDGAAGWEALQTHNYNLVITDNKMPRMTGVEMIQNLRSASINVPVIMATGNIPVHEFARRPWLKPEVLLEKPYTDEDLMGAVKKVLHPDG